MRGYAKISPQFWIGDTGRKLRNADQEAILVALYLLSNPHANMLGLYYLPMLYVAHETGLGMEGASKGLRAAIEAGFCDYDEATEVVFVYEMAHFQIADQLEPKDKRCTGIQREYDALPNNSFLSEFYDKYATAFHLKNRRGSTSPIEGTSTALQSQEQEQELEQDHEKLSDAEASVVIEAVERATNPCHVPIRALIQQLHQKMFGVKCQWDGSEGKALDRLLSANPSWKQEQVAQMVRNRFESDGITGSRPRSWLPRLDDYAGAPLDRYNKLKGAGSNGNGSGNRAQQRQLDNLAALDTAFPLDR